MSGRGTTWVAAFKWFLEQVLATELREDEGYMVSIMQATIHVHMCDGVAFAKLSMSL